MGDQTRASQGGARERKGLGDFYEATKNEREGRQKVCWDCDVNLNSFPSFHVYIRVTVSLFSFDVHVSFSLSLESISDHPFFPVLFLSFSLS